MKRALALCLFLAVSCNVASAAVTYFPPLRPMTTTNTVAPQVQSVLDPYGQNMLSQSVNYPQLDRIERTLYRRIYSGQDIMLRLARLEKSIFNTTYPTASLSQRVDNIVGNFNQMNQYNGISGNVLAKIESRIFNQNYAADTPEARIERLEQQIFGAAQSGDLLSRYARLKVASNKYTSSMYNPAYSPVMGTMGNQGGWKGVVGSLGNILLGGGNMTGFTPPIDPLYGGMYNGYSSPAMMSSPGGYGYYNGNRSNTGYSDRFSNYGSHTGVTILD